MKQLADIVKDSVKSGSRVGVALSGGADSVALLLALHEANEYHLTALHCNFGLRGEESDGDERFCVEICQQLGIKLVTVRFDPADREPGESTEMACRRQRYDWFVTQARALNFDVIAIAHHADDNLETLMLNLLRGSGARGLSGIAPRRDIYVRPLLGVTREEILAYLRERGVQWRTDSTNLSTDYRRNALRLEILPLIRQHFLGADAGMHRTIATMRHADAMLRHYMSLMRGKYVTPSGEIFLDRLRDETPDPFGVLYCLLQDIYNAATPDSVVESIIGCHTSGCRFQLPTARIEYSHGRLVEIPEIDSDATATLPLGETGECQFGDRVIVAEIVDYETFANGCRNADHAWLSLDEITKRHPSPVALLRHPRVGDRMRPFGMRGTRLLSDIFADRKLSAAEKQRAVVVTLGDDILWLPGLRASALYAVKHDTHHILHLYCR